MSQTEIRRSLSDIRDGIDVPPLDRDAVLGRARWLRRRRRGAVVLGSAAAVAVLAVGTSVLAPAVVGPDGPGPAATSTSPAVGPVERPDVLVEIEGERRQLTGDGRVVDPASPPPDVTLLPGADGWTDTYIQRLPSFAGPEASGAGPLATGELWDTDPDAYVLDDDGYLVVFDAEGAHPVEPPAGGVFDVRDAQLAGDTLAVVDGDAVSFFDRDGRRRGGDLGGVRGALSDDGTTWATAPTAGELGRGVEPGLRLVDTTTSAATRVDLDEPAREVAWRGALVYVVTERGDERALWQCDTASCTLRHTDPTGTLELPDVSAVPVSEEPPGAP